MTVAGITFSTVFYLTFVLTHSGTCGERTSFELPVRRIRGKTFLILEIRLDS